MRKLSIFFMLALILSTLLFSAASAATIAAVPTALDPDHLEQTASYARILGYNEENDTLTVELIYPETFPANEVEALKAGDSILTNGNEVLVETIESARWGVYAINEADEPNFVFLEMDENGNYRTKRYGDDIWITLAKIECPLQDSLLFLDYIDHQTGTPRTLPAVHTARELTEELLFTEAYEAFTAGLTCNNVYVTFDEAGNLATIHRFHVPWQ